jgi:hypothetical protein
MSRGSVHAGRRLSQTGMYENTDQGMVWVCFLIRWVSINAGVVLDGNVSKNGKGVEGENKT